MLKKLLEIISGKNRELGKIARLVDAVNALESDVAGLSDAELTARSRSIQEKAKKKSASRRICRRRSLWSGKPPNAP